MNGATAGGTPRGPRTGTSDENYNLISVLYHALQGAETCARYIVDAEQGGDEELANFLREAQDVQRQLAGQAKQLLQRRLG